MKYRSIGEYKCNDTIVMKPGDIIVISKNKIYNITTGYDYCLSNEEEPLIMRRLEAVTDEVKNVSVITDADRFKKITETMLDVFKKKNHDYGNSFDQSLDKFGLIASVVRLSDKMNRIESLINKEAQVKDESIRDTIMDMANYCIMTAMCLNKQCNL